MWPYKCGAAGNPESTTVDGLDGIPWDTLFSSDSHTCHVLPYLAIIIITIIITVIIILLGVLYSEEGNASS